MIDLPETQAIVTYFDQGWLQIQLNTPENRNALSDIMVSDITRVLEKVRHDHSVRGISFRGNGGIFCAGGDLKGFRAIYKLGTAGKPIAEELSLQAGKFFALIANMPQLTIALIEGAAMAGGFGIACCCDVVASTPGAKFALSETRIGITPAQIAPYVLSRLGPSRGKRMMLLGSHFNGEDAHKMGFVDYLTTEAKDLSTLEDQVRSETMACAPSALAVTKDIVRQVQSNLSADEFVKKAANTFADAIVGDEGREGISSFLEKRKPDWTV